MKLKYRIAGWILLMAIVMVSWSKYVGTNDITYVQETTVSDEYPVKASFMSQSSIEAVDLVEVGLEVAQTPYEKAVGLMYRESLEDNTGMLFVYDEDSQGAFWMKNTLIPLDIIYIDANGIVVSISENAQPCKEDPCTKYPSDTPYRYVIEVNGGWTQVNGIGVGDRVVISGLSTD